MCSMYPISFQPAMNVRRNYKVNPAFGNRVKYVAPIMTTAAVAVAAPLLMDSFSSKTTIDSDIKESSAKYLKPNFFQELLLFMNPEMKRAHELANELKSLGAEVDIANDHTITIRVDVSGKDTKWLKMCPESDEGNFCYEGLKDNKAVFVVYPYTFGKSYNNINYEFSPEFNNNKDPLYAINFAMNFVKTQLTISTFSGPLGVPYLTIKTALYNKLNPTIQKVEKDIPNLDIIDVGNFHYDTNNPYSCLYWYEGQIKYIHNGVLHVKHTPITDDYPLSQEKILEKLYESIANEKDSKPISKDEQINKFLKAAGLDFTGKKDGDYEQFKLGGGTYYLINKELLYEILKADIESRHMYIWERQGIYYQRGCPIR